MRVNSEHWMASRTGAHDVAPCSKPKVPGGQGSGALISLSGHSKPMKQVVQIALVPGLNVPGKHAASMVLPGPGTKNPGSAAMQEVAPLSARVV